MKNVYVLYYFFQTPLKMFKNFKWPERNSRRPNAGRRSLEFLESSERSKRRKTADVRASYCSDELAYATQMKFRQEGKTDCAAVLKNVALGSPSKAKTCRSSLESLHKERGEFTPDEALSLLIELELSRNRYQLLRNALLSKNDKVLPSYKRVNKAKKKCFPSDTISVTNTSAEIAVQALLDHTTARILETQVDVIERFSEEQLSNLKLICKWGGDGSSGHSQYKQKLSEEDISDGSVVLIAFVPLQLICENESQTHVLWKNPRPSSTRFCRPIEIVLAKETADFVREKIGKIQKQIDTLNPYEAVIHRKNVQVNYELCLTMIDGKVCNALTETTSAQRCFLCGATTSEFNKLELISQKPINEDNYRFGVSSLHAWLRCFECILHLSYKLDVKRWQVRQKPDRKGKVKTPEEEKAAEEERKKIEEMKKSIADNKTKIQKEFKSKLALLVDMPKPGGGTTNDGNTARRFFENYEQSAIITGVDKNLIHRFYIILQTISSGFAVNIEKFEKYALDTAAEFVKLYSWYHMPTTVHKLLIHGGKIIKHALLPIGQMSEDAQESCNKYFKRYRENFARKNFRNKTMEDVYIRFLISSDPVISTCRRLPRKPLKTLSPEAVDLLIPPAVDFHDNFNEKFLFDTDSEISSDTSRDALEDISDEEGSFCF